MKVLRVILLAALCMCFFTPFITEARNADIQTGDKWAKGTVRAGETIYFYAPMGGQLEAFDLSIGDDIRRNEVIMRVRPIDVPAPYDGTIRVQHAQIGDIAGNVVREYGALCYLERPDIQRIETSSSTAYDDAKNRDIHVGEELRAYNNKTGSNKKEALGRVVSANGASFVVEFPAGIFDFEESVSVYRGEGSEYRDKDKVGKGKVQRAPVIAIAAEGVIADILVREEETVLRGQPLYYMDAIDARYEAAGQRQVTGPDDCVLTAIYAQPGQRVAKGQLLAAAMPLHDLECVVDVDELDILTLSVGQTMLVKLDALPNDLIEAAIERISPLGKIMLDTTKYEVTLRFTGEIERLLPGMHVTAYWN